MTAAPTRALVLGGGGPVGRAWQLGLAIGLGREGLDLQRADLIVGTSAGAIVGAQIALGLDLPALAQSLRTDREPPVAPDASGAMGRLARSMADAATAADPTAIRQRIGREALAAKTYDEQVSLSRPTFRSLRHRAWPTAFRATAVNARTGTFQLWDADSAVPLDVAAASSSALPGVYPPITIDGDPYVDGGVRSMLNADVASGSTTVLVVSAFALSPPGERSSPVDEALRAELETVRSSGAHLDVITPGAELVTLTAGGTRMLDRSLIAEAVTVGARQGALEAARLDQLWPRRTHTEGKQR